MRGLGTVLAISGPYARRRPATSDRQDGAGSLYDRNEEVVWSAVAKAFAPWQGAFMLTLPDD